MGLTRFLAALAATLCSSLISQALAANPIKVTGCTPSAPQTTNQTIAGQPQYQPGSTGRLAITFANAGAQPATSITFGLVQNGKAVAQPQAKGTFSPHVKIAQTFSLNKSIFPLAPAKPQCIALRVKWKDGTYWVNPHMPTLLSVP
jgi:hypothetical protein